MRRQIAPCGRGSESGLCVISDLPSRDRRERTLEGFPSVRMLTHGGSRVACTTLLMLGCVSCTHEVQIASQAPPHTKTHAVLARQVENAVDFGDNGVDAPRWGHGR